MAPTGTAAHVSHGRTDPGIHLYWLPLGAGAHVVRFSGRAFEALTARRERRPRQDLYHSALEAVTGDGRYVIEMTPVPDGRGAERGVVAEGAVGTHWARCLRLFRYEIRCWRDGTIADLDDAAGSTLLVDDSALAERLLERVLAVPTPVWGRDELRAGEMWNSNSVTAWLLARVGLDPAAVALPPDGRAPGWRAGGVIAGRARGRAATG